MESLITLLALFLIITATAVIACLMIYNRKRQQQTLPKVGETPLTPVEEARPGAIQEAQPLVAEMQPTALDEAELTRAQEAQPIAEEVPWATVEETQETVLAEAQPTIIKEIQTLPAEETQVIQVIGAEDTQGIATKETEPTATEQAQPQGAEKVQPKGAEEPGEAIKREPPEPIKRGGKPRGPAQGLEKERTQETKPRRPHPEIVCWKREQQWVLAVEVPEELLENPDLKVLQNGSPLPRDESAEALWHLEDVCNKVIIRWNEAGAPKEAKVGLGQEEYLLFKLSGRNLNQGRLVKSPSSGSYLVVAPDAWERDETLSGPPPVMPEPVSLASYKAHFFDLDKSSDQKIAFRLPDGPSLVIEAKAPRFELFGRQLTDASEHMGPLFGEMPPRIRALDAQAWKNVRTIVVGEEGSSRGKWRTAFSPDRGQMERDLPSEVAARKSGWYFLRFYDTNDDLIESLDFRYISALKEMNVQQPSPLPPEEGHGAVLVEFIHEPNCTVQQVNSSTNIQIEGKPDRTILTVPPDPTCDLSLWRVSPQDGPPVEVVVLVERIWWAPAEEDNTPSQWTDKPVVLSREDFAATSSKALWLRLPRRHWVDRVFAGFERSRARPYNVRVAEKTIAVPLRDYGDSQEVGNQTQEYSFRVWVERDGGLDEGVLAIIPASQPRAACMPAQVVPPLTQSWEGFGRKKTAIAKAVIQNGSGEITLNGQPVDEYFRRTPEKAKRFLRRLVSLQEVNNVLSHMEVNVTITGSSPRTTRQPKAVAHAIARALMSYDRRLKPLLRQEGFGGVKVRGSGVGRRDKR